MAGELDGEVKLFYLKPYLRAEQADPWSLKILNMKTTNKYYRLAGEVRASFIGEVATALTTLVAHLAAPVMLCVVPRSNPESEAPWLCEAVALAGLQDVALVRTVAVREKSRDAELHATTIGVSDGGVSALKAAGTVVLIDDVFTSGSTMEGCTAALRAAVGADDALNVVWFVLGRTPSV